MYSILLGFLLFSFEFSICFLFPLLLRWQLENEVFSNCVTLETKVPFSFRWALRHPCCALWGVHSVPVSIQPVFLDCGSHLWYHVQWVFLQLSLVQRLCLRAPSILSFLVSGLECLFFSRSLQFLWNAFSILAPPLGTATAGNPHRLTRWFCLYQIKLPSTMVPVAANPA